MKSKIHRYLESLIGTEVLYNDYLGYDVIGTIKYAEEDPRLEDGVVFVYLFDEESLSLNNKTKILPDGTSIKYAEIRKSTEVQPTYSN